MLSGRVQRQTGADLLLLLVALIWGSTFVMVKDAVTDYPVFPFLTLRFGFATVGLLLIGGKRLRTLGWRGVGAGVLIGLFLFAGYAFQTVGLRSTTASKAGFITGLSVVIVPILSTVLLRRIPSFSAVIGVCLATVGLGLLTLDGGLYIARGDLIVLGCAVSFALHIVTVSAYAPDTDPLALTIIQIITVAILSALASGVTSAPWPAPTASTWFAAGFTGVLATAVAFAVQTAVQRFTTPTHTALIFAAEPVFAAIFGILLAGDSLTGRAVAGGTLIVAGTMASEIRWSKTTATIISRFMGPHYVALPLLFVLAMYGSTSWQQGLLWSLGSGAVSIAMPLLLLRRELQRGKISDWHITNRHERLRPVPVLATLSAALVPLALLHILDGPPLLLIAFINAALLVVVGLLITTSWKISQHVCSVAAATTLVTATVGVGVAPALLLIPIVAWARVKIQAHTLMQTVAGGIMGVSVTLITLHLSGLI